MSGNVRLLYDFNYGRNACDSVRLFRSSAGPDGPYALLATERPPDGAYLDKAPNGNTFYYRMICDYDNRTSAATWRAQGRLPDLDPYPPEAHMNINNGAFVTNSLEVHLSSGP